MDKIPAIGKSIATNVGKCATETVALSLAERTAIAKEAVETARQAALAEGVTHGKIGAIVSQEGKVLGVGRSTRAGGPCLSGAMDDVAKAYENVPVQPRAPTGMHGACCEVPALSQSQKAGNSLEGAVSIAADVRSGQITAPAPRKGRNSRAAKEADEPRDEKKSCRGRASANWVMSRD